MSAQNYVVGRSALRTSTPDNLVDLESEAVTFTLHLARANRHAAQVGRIQRRSRHARDLVTSAEIEKFDFCAAFHYKAGRWKKHQLLLRFLVARVGGIGICQI